MLASLELPKEIRQAFNPAQELGGGGPYLALAMGIAARHSRQPKVPAQVRRVPVLLRRTPPVQ